MKLNIKSKILCPILASLLIAGCGAEEEEESMINGVVDESDVKNAVPDMGVLLIDIPSSVAGSSSEGGLRLQDNSGDGDDGGGMQNLFLMPRQFIGVSEMLMDMVQEIAYHLFGKPACRDDDTSNDPTDCAQFPGLVSGAITETPTIFEVPTDPDDSGAPNYVKYFKNAAGSTYNYTFQMYWLNTSDNLYYKGMELQVSRTGEDTGKGSMQFFTGVIPEDEEDEEDEGGAPGVVITTFDNSGDTATISVNLYEMQDPNEDGSPDRMGLTISVADGILTGAGTLIRPELASASTGMPPFETQDEFAWVFTIAANTNDDVAVQSMAFPTVDNYSDSDNFFTSYGIDSIIKNIILALLRDNIDDNVNCAVVGGYLTGSNLPSNICRNQTDVTDAAVLAGVKAFCDANSNNQLCTGLAGQGDAWSNPVYLNSDGYVGNESNNKPTDATYDGLVDLLDAIDLYEPATLKAETVPTSGDGVAAVE